MTSEEIRAGVVGVGRMGKRHARVYKELQDVELVGVADADVERASSVASDYGTEGMDTADLFEAVDVVTIAVPTRYHYEVALEAITEDVSVLVEKPFVKNVSRGKELIRKAAAADVVLQVGHVERFNPVMDVLQRLVPDLDVISVSARRLGPPLDRKPEDDVVMDLMIHDIDVVLSLLSSEPQSVTANGTRNGRHATALFDFDDGIVGKLTASRVTQKKIRDFAITARECRVEVDYIAQSVQIHRQSSPEYLEGGDGYRFRNENVIERPMVESGEPLKREQRSFVESVRDGTEPVVTGEDGLIAMSIAREISSIARNKSETTQGIQIDDIQPV